MSWSIWRQTCDASFVSVPLSLNQRASSFTRPNAQSPQPAPNKSASRSFAIVSFNGGITSAGSDHSKTLWAMRYNGIGNRFAKLLHPLGREQHLGKSSWHSDLILSKLSGAS